MILQQKEQAHRTKEADSVASIVFRGQYWLPHQGKAVVRLYYTSEIVQKPTHWSVKLMDSYTCSISNLFKKIVSNTFWVKSYIITK